MYQTTAYGLNFHNQKTELKNRFSKLFYNQMKICDILVNFSKKLTKLYGNDDVISFRMTSQQFWSFQRLHFLLGYYFVPSRGFTRSKYPGADRVNHICSYWDLSKIIILNKYPYIQWYKSLIINVVIGTWLKCFSHKIMIGK